MKSLFGRVKVTFYPRMHECREDVKASQGIGRAIIYFCEEYAYEIESVYGETLAKLQREVDTVDVGVAGPSLMTDWPAEMLEPKTYPSGLRRHVIFIYVRSLVDLAGAFERTHQEEDKNEIVLFSVGLIFFQLVHIRVEDDQEIIAERSQELSELLESDLGAWMVSGCNDAEQQEIPGHNDS